MDQSNEYTNYEGIANDYVPNWEAEGADMDNTYPHDASLSETTTTDRTNSLGFQQQPIAQEEEDATAAVPEIFQYNQGFPSEEINAEMDYETLIRTKELFYDPQPRVIRKPAPTNPVVYNQNIIVRFLQPPPISQGPLIIREVRPPQPPPPPPLVNESVALQTSSSVFFSRQGYSSTCTTSSFTSTTYSSRTTSTDSSHRSRSVSFPSKYSTEFLSSSSTSCH